MDPTGPKSWEWRRLPGSRIEARVQHAQRERGEDPERGSSPPPGPDPAFAGGKLPGERIRARCTHTAEKEPIAYEAYEDQAELIYCYVCGGGYTRASLGQHMARCLKKRASVEEATLPPSLRVDLKAVSFQVAQCIPIPEPYDDEALAKYNAEAKATYEASMPMCPECGRTFTWKTDAITVHMRSCCPELLDEITGKYFHTGSGLQEKLRHVKCPICNRSFSNRSLETHLPLCRLNAAQSPKPPPGAVRIRSPTQKLAESTSSPGPQWRSDFPERDEGGVQPSEEFREEEADAPGCEQAEKSTQSGWMGGEAPPRDYALSEVPTMWREGLRPPESTVRDARTYLGGMEASDPRSALLHLEGAEPLSEEDAAALRRNKPPHETP